VRDELANPEVQEHAGISSFTIGVRMIGGK